MFQRIAIYGLLAAASGSTWAALPAAADLTIPTRDGERVVFEWEGIAPPGACNTQILGSATDALRLDVKVPDGAYRRVAVDGHFRIEWDDPQQNLLLALREPGQRYEAGEAFASANGRAAEESIRMLNPPAGPLEVVACAFDAATPTAYRGQVTLTARAASKVTAPPSADPQGLAFAASMPSDIQRDEGEPLIEIDQDGRIITCGPTGFSQAEDYAQMSLDGGDQFQILGEPPRGQQSLGGGGDCAMAAAPERNADGFFQLSYVGLSGLANFTAGTSPDGGRTWLTSPISESIPGVDRQWNVFSDAETVFLSYNQVAPRAITLQRSEDGGLTYGLPEVVSPNPSFPGPMRALPPELNPADNGEPAVYYTWGQGITVRLAVSLDNGATWNNCTAVEALGSPDNQFTAADHDNAGNIYVAYTDATNFNTFVASAPPEALLECQGGTEGDFSNPPLFSRPVQVNRDDVVTSVFPWLTAGGEPGRVAVAFYGSKVPGRPDDASLPHTWHVYVSQSLNANTGEPAWSQVQATTHPNHYGQVCLLGLGCSTGGDRSLVDFFALDYNPVSGELLVVYNRAHKRPGDAVGLVSTPVVLRQIDGPSHAGGFVERAGRRALRDAVEDPAGDAFADFSSLFTPPMPTEVPALDLTGVRVLPPDSGDGFTVEMRIDDLSSAALQNALLQANAQSLLWIFRYVDGYRYSAAVASWNPAGFSFGHNGFVASIQECGSPPVFDEGQLAGAQEPDQCLYYPGDTPIEGEVDQAAGVIRMTVPLEFLKALSDEDDPALQPREVDAMPGDRIYTAAAFAQSNSFSPSQDVQSFLQPIDNTPPMDFLIPGGPQTQPDDVDEPAGRTAGTGGDRGGALALWMLGFLLLALLRRRPCFCG